MRLDCDIVVMFHRRFYRVVYGTGTGDHQKSVPSDQQELESEVRQKRVLWALDNGFEFIEIFEDNIYEGTTVVLR